MAEELFANIFQQKAEELHGDEWRIVMDDSIEADRPANGWYQYIRGTFANFRCSLCKRFWSSRRVLVVLHFHLDKTRHKGVVKVRRYRQDCKKCTEARMEVPIVKRENVEVIMEKLIEKIRMRCYGENLGKTNRPSHFTGRVNGPHESAHCEACQKGICRQGT